MKTRISLILMSLMLTIGWSARADETVTVTANSEDISAGLDLKAVATLFGQSENLEKFEADLNNEEKHLSNLDLNGDGNVDYIRVVEQAEGQKHLILLQAVLAKDIFQDVASIYVEKDPATQEVTTQIVGDEYVYGVNYIVEPAYLYHPVIYDWFWGPYWTCWHSPFYWDYWPYWYHPWHCWAMHDYWHHIYDYHHYHHYCSYRHPARPRPGYEQMHHQSGSRRGDLATRRPESSFASRNANRMGVSGRAVSNARDLQPSRNAVTGSPTRGGAATATRGGAPTGQSRSANVDRTFGSANTRIAATATRGNGQSVSRGNTQATATRGGSQPTVSRGGSQATATRTTTATAARPSGNTVTRSTTATATRPSSSTTTRSGSTQTASRSSQPTVNRSSSSSVSRSTSAPSVSRGSSSAPSRTSSYSGGSSSHSSGGYSGGGSRGGGYSGGGSHSGGGSSSRGGGGGGGRR